MPVHEYEKDSIGPRLKRIRVEAGVTQADMALKLGVKQQVVAGYESSESNPTYNTLKKFAKVVDKRLQINFIDC